VCNLLGVPSLGLADEGLVQEDCAFLKGPLHCVYAEVVTWTEGTVGRLSLEQVLFAVMGARPELLLSRFGTVNPWL
jgi:hypothetical protein